MVGEDGVEDGVAPTPAVLCHPVEGLFLSDPDVVALRASAERAQNDGVDVVFLADGQSGDAIVMAAGLAAVVRDLAVGIRQSLGPVPHRHPTVLARELTTLDHVTGGRVLLAFTGPFTKEVSAATLEAVTLCRDMWRKGIAVSDGPRYPATGAVNRPLPQTPGGPPIALDLTDGSAPAEGLLAACDLVLVPAGAAPPDTLPSGVGVCWIRTSGAG